MNEKTTNPDILAEAEEMEKEVENAPVGAETITFRKPFTFEGKTYKELTFDWDKLTGRDSLDVERELSHMNVVLLVPSINGEYLVRIAAKACTTPIGYDLIESLPLWEYNQVRGAARNFLNRAG